MYLFLLNKLIHQNKWRTLFILLFPLFLIFIIFPFITKTIEESTVPIVIVNDEESDFTMTILDRVSEHPRLKLQYSDEERARDLVTKGDVEAAFLFDKNFEENIRNGKLKDQIIWLRTENSFFDTFVKEKLASEVMRLSLNSIAANELIELKQEENKGNFEQYFNHSESYWEPEPLFNVEFIAYQGSPELSGEQVDTNRISLGILGFWLFYLWITFALILLPLYSWKEKGILDRVQLVKGSLVPFYCSYYFLAVCFAIGLGIALSLITASVIDFQYTHTQVLGIMTAIAIIIFAITIFLQLVFQRNHFLFTVILFSMCSFTFSTITILSEGQHWWYHILPHVWLYELFS